MSITPEPPLKKCEGRLKHGSILNGNMGLRRVSSQWKSTGQPSSVDDAALRDNVLMISRITGDVLAEKGFSLKIPTDTLASALFPQNGEHEDPLFSIDCDTSSLILLTVAENIGLNAALVEMRLGSGAGHNFVRWNLSDGESVDWDTNGRTQCSAPTDTPTYQGRSMSRDETLAYLTTIRAQDWDRRNETLRALSDYRLAIQLAQAHPVAFNNFVWIVATRDFPGREKLKIEALGYGDTLILIERSAGNLDTAACIAAYAGDFTKAASLEREAIRLAPDENVFEERLKYFTANQPRDCTGVR
ncbi:hypothetical protein [Rhizobium sp. SL42]|uniref:hypothetical protein n=1 Tax=Rhizobium sp. SL42 TaxID=2806346 RepID=UPI001F42D9B0|nr:hypothetical protein [Rhizobium sp. SL42]UJW73543.1 hypothetical protein IM739_11530 [Rhizobium sp. SL42]